MAKKQELAKSRIHPCLVSSISKYLEGVGLPRIYGPAVAMTLISSVIGRRFYFHTKRGAAYLNGYRFLIGMPGIGKSLATDFIRRVIEESQLEVPIAPSSITKASLVDDLAKSNHQRPWGKDRMEAINTALINSSEYGVFVGMYNSDELFQTMCELFDGRYYKETRRGLKEDLEIPKPYVNMITGSQPEHFAGQFPRRAWSLGYATRCDFYYSDDIPDDTDYYADYDPVQDKVNSETVVAFAREVAHDLQFLIADFNTKFSEQAHQVMFAPDGWEEFKFWSQGQRRDTELKHPWLIDYNVRRAFRLRRDAILFSLARHDTDYYVHAEDIRKAIALHSECEEGLLTLLNRIQQSEDGDVIATVHAWAIQECVKKKRTIPQSVLMEYLLNKVDAFKAKHMLETLVTMEVLIKKTTYRDAHGNEFPCSMPQYQPNLKWISSKGRK